MGHSLLLFREYMGTGLIVAWFLFAWGYLFLKEERKQIRILLVYVPMLVLVLFFNPLFAAVLARYMGDEIYYRILWLLPITVVIAYATVVAGSRLAGKKRTIFAMVSVVLVMVSGSYIYNNAYFTKAQNIYHIPDSVVNICDAIELPGREVMAVFPLEMIQYVRQYSPVVCMPYGREILTESWNEWAVQHDLCDALEAEVIDARVLGELAIEYGCIYIVLPDNRPVEGSLAEAGYDLFLETDGYCVYRNEALITF